MPGPVFLDGDRITLRVPGQEDVDFLAENVNDPRIRAGRTATMPKGRDEIQRYVGGTTGRDGDSIVLLVCADDRNVGLMILNREKLGDRAYDRAELAYWIAPDAQGNGYATAASELLIEHAFSTLGLHKLTIKAFATNEASLGVIEKIGFEREGTFREEAFVDGEWVDYHRYGLLADEWRD